MKIKYYRNYRHLFHIARNSIINISFQSMVTNPTSACVYAYGLTGGLY
ncbi:MAG: hypothetical protein IPG78_15200 [Ignavibacteria bacterium]|nr:hypothetical protein [Ignavibacteria bacterium]